MRCIVMESSDTGATVASAFNECRTMHTNNGMKHRDFFKVNCIKKINMCSLVLERESLHNVQLAGLRTYSCHRTPSQSRNKSFSGSRYRCIAGNYRSGTVRDSHPCSLFIAARRQRDSEPMRAQIYNFSANCAKKSRASN